jgi:Ca-activated chloride channel family protein
MKIHLARSIIILLLVIGFNCFILAQSGRHRATPKSSPPPDNISTTSSSQSQTTTASPPVIVEKGEDIPGADTLKIDATLVSVPTIVSDPTGRYVPFLKAEDFNLYEDNVPQQISLFSSEKLPFSVALVLDTSGSITDSMAGIQESAKRFVYELREDDKVMVVEFNSNVKVLNELSSDRDLIQHSIDKTRAGGSTRLYDALYEVAQRFKSVEGRKAIILLTDGEDTSSRQASEKKAIDEVIESGALTYVIQFPDTEELMGQKPTMRTPSTFPTAGGATNRIHYPDSTFLHQLVDLSGGDMYYAGGTNGLPDIWSKIAEELRYVYVLGYYPTNPVEKGGFRQIRVQLREKASNTIHYKHGYSAHSAKPASESGSANANKKNL